LRGHTTRSPTTSWGMRSCTRFFTGAWIQWCY
jgi:hypothetical protein